MDLGDYVKALRRSWMAVCVFALIGVLAGAGMALVATPTYSARTQLFVAIQSSGTVSELQQGNSFSQARVQSYVKTARTPIVLQPVIDELGLEASSSSLAKQVEASADPNTVLITITTLDESPVRAAAIAQSVAESLVSAVAELEGDSPVKLSVVTPAAAPATPSSPNVSIYILVGLLFGLGMGIAFAIVRAQRDSKVRGEADLRRVSGAPLLGAIAYDVDAAKKPLVTQTDPQGPRAEAFRHIRTNLQFAHISNKSKAVLVTSSLPEEGKSTTATNLAISIAQSGKSVVLIDADLRRPRVHEYLGLERNAGLTTALIGHASLNDLLQPWGRDELYVLTSGQIPPNPSELLGSKAMEDVIKELENKFDAVIIDAPPLLPVTDSTILAQLTGGVILVIGSSKITTSHLEKSLGALRFVDAQVLGVVFNLLPVKGPDAHSYGYYTYSAVDIESTSSAPDGSEIRMEETGRRSRREHDPSLSATSGAHYKRDTDGA